MPGISQFKSRAQWQKTPTACSTGRLLPQKMSVFSTLKSAFCSCVSRDAVIMCHSDKKRSNQESERLQNQPEVTNVPSAFDDAAVRRGQLPGVRRLEPISHDSDSEDDDISVISLGEARRLAQLRIDGVSIPPITPSPIKDALSKSAPSSTVPTKRTLPPIEPIYRKKATSALKKVLRGKKVADCGSISASDKKQSKEQKREAKREAKEKKEQLKRSKKREKLTTWLKETRVKVDSSTNAPTFNGSENLMTREHSKIADLHKRISEMEKKRVTKQKEITLLMERMEKGGEDLKLEIKKQVKGLRRTDLKIRKLKADVFTKENKVKQLTSKPNNRTPIKESGQVGPDNRAVSDTNTTLTPAATGKVNTVTVTRGPRVVTVKPSPEKSTKAFPARPSTAVRRFFMGPDTTTVTPRERMIKDMLKVEQKAREDMFERPRAAHPSRVRSLTENVQEFLPYDLGHFDSDSEDEEPRRQDNDIGAAGLRKFEELQNAKSRNTATKRGYSTSTTNDSDDDFDFLLDGSEVKTPRTRPPTRCSNPVPPAEV